MALIVALLHLITTKGLRQIIEHTVLNNSEYSYHSLLLRFGVAIVIIVMNHFCC